MKILVVSDSHGYLNYIHRAISVEQPDYMIHLGDHSRDADQIKDEYSRLPVVMVKGNCDFYDPCTPEQANLDFFGIRIFATHGHTYNVKNGLLRFFMAAKEKAVNVALFGHTHCALCEKKDDIWLMNPGSCGIHSKGNYGMIEIIDKTVTCSIKTVEREDAKA